MANGVFYNGNTSTLEITGSLNASTFGITGSLVGVASTASYVNLVAGPNVTINQVGTAFEISASGGGGAGGADTLVVSSNNLLLQTGSTVLSTTQIYPASSSVSASYAVNAGTASVLLLQPPVGAIQYNNSNQLSGSTLTYIFSGANAGKFTTFSGSTDNPALFNLYSSTFSTALAWGNTSLQGYLGLADGSSTSIVIGHLGNSYGRPGHIYISHNETAAPKLFISGGGQVGIYQDDSVIANIPTFAADTDVQIGDTGKTASTRIYGRLGIGLTANASYLLELATDTAAKPSTNTWTISSDSRIKTNIQPYTKSLDDIIQLNPVTYEYNGKAGFNITGSQIGVIAQEVLPYFPECIKTYETKLEETDETPTELYTFDSHALTFAMINAVKELKTLADSNQTLIESLQNQINNR